MDKEIVMWLGGLILTAFGVVLLYILKGIASDVKATRQEMEKLGTRVTAMEAKVDVVWTALGRKLQGLFNGHDGPG